MQIKTVQVTVDDFSKPNSSCTLTASCKATFTGNLISAAVAFQGWQVSFGSDKDHMVRRSGANIYDVKVISGSKLKDPHVEFSVSLTLKDGSGNMIDRSDSWATVLVMAETQSF